MATRKQTARKPASKARKPASKARKPASKAPAKVAPKLAAISPLTAAQVAKGFAGAVRRVEGAQHTFMQTCVATAALIGMPVTASQYDKQLAPSIREHFKARNMRHLAETTLASHRSRLKTFVLAACSGLDAFQPVAGETMPVFLARIAEPLASAKLGDGRTIWDVAKQGRTASAPGSKDAGKSGGASGPPTTGGSAGSVNDDEGGLDVAPAMAAALILTRQNVSRAQRLVTVLGNYAEEFDRWTATILSEDDKTALAKLAPPKADTVTRSATPPAPKVTPQTALEAALIQGQRKANEKAKAKQAA